MLCDRSNDDRCNRDAIGAEPEPLVGGSGWPGLMVRLLLPESHPTPSCGVCCGFHRIVEPRCGLDCFDPPALDERQLAGCPPPTEREHYILGKFFAVASVRGYKGGAFPYSHME